MNDVDPQEINLLHDHENSHIYQGALFSDVIAFRKVTRHYAVKKEFEFVGLNTDKVKFTTKCKSECIFLALRCSCGLLNSYTGPSGSSWWWRITTITHGRACVGHGLWGWVL